MHPKLEEALARVRALPESEHDRWAKLITKLVLASQRKSEIESAVTEADKGAFISEENLTAWFLSLGTDNELPEPSPDVFHKR